MKIRRNRVKIGIVGCGAIGEGVALFLDKELKDKAKIWALADIDLKKANHLKNKLTQSPKICEVEVLVRGVDLIIETASQECALNLLQKAINLKKDIIILSVGALIKDLSLLKKAKKCGIKIYVPSGAICGIDGLGALALANIKSITLTTSKPPQGLIGAEYLKRKKIKLEDIKKEKIVYSGDVFEAIKYFPKNINVAATLFLAAGGKRVKVYIKANPSLKRNAHCVDIKTKEVSIRVVVESIPSKINPKTSILAILSTQYLLRKIFSSFKIGS